MAIREMRQEEVGGGGTETLEWAQQSQLGALAIAELASASQPPALTRACS